MILSTDFNPIELESKIEQDYNASQGSYATGEWDALVGGDPNPDEWHSEEYRQGYLKGVESKYDSLYSVSSL